MYKLIVVGVLAGVMGGLPVAAQVKSPGQGANRVEIDRHRHYFLPERQRATHPSHQPARHNDQLVHVNSKSQPRYRVRTACVSHVRDKPLGTSTGWLSVPPST